MNFLQETERIIREKIDDYISNNGFEPRFLLMDDVSYFDLKVAIYGSSEVASEVEIDEFLDLRVFYNRLGYRNLDVAG